jgi:hypothetical protein
MGGLMATLLCVFATTGCEAEPPRTPLPVAKFAFSFDRSGGFAPMPQRLIVKPGRRATAVAVGPDRKSHRVEFRLSVATAKRLRDAAEAADLAKIGAEEPGTCADCFLYTVAYRGDSVTVDQASLPPELARLVSRSEAVIAAHLPFH